MNGQGRSQRVDSGGNGRSGGEDAHEQGSRASQLALGGWALVGSALHVRGLAAAFLSVGALLLAVAPSSLAIGQRGHAFAFAFGVQGKGAGQFSEPTGVGVNDSTGDVYVADRKNKVVEEFEPVLKEGEPAEEHFVREFAVALPEAVAVDNSQEAGDPSKGDVYVVGQKGKAIFKFDEDGNLIVKLNKFEEGSEKEKFESIEGIAVDAQGQLLVYEGATHAVDVFTDAKINESASSQGTGGTLAAKLASPGFAVDGEGSFYLGTTDLSTEAEERQFEEERETQLSEIVKLKAGSETPSSRLGSSEQTTAVAVDPTDDSTYVDKVVNNNKDEGGGQPTSTVDAYTASGSLTQELGAPGLDEADAVAVDPTTHAIYVADGFAGRIDVFELEPPGKPTIEGLSACELRLKEAPPAPQCPEAEHAVELHAKVDPEGQDTHYFFEYGTASCAANPGTCETSSPVDAGSGFGDQQASLQLADLGPGTHYYRVVAENASGTVRSAEGTLAVAELASGLPDGRAWEMVSPVDKGGAEPEAITKEGGTIMAAENGDAITYVADGPMPAQDNPEGNRSPEFTQVLSTRGSESWLSQDITTANETAAGIVVGVPPEYKLFSPNLALGIVEPTKGAQESTQFERPPLSKEATEKTIYLRDDRPLSPEASEAADYKKAEEEGAGMKNPGFLAVVTASDAPEKLPFGGGQSEGVQFMGASPDLTHVVFQIMEPRKAPGTYEWNGPEQKTVEAVTVLPKQTTPVSPKAAWLGGQEGENQRNAISADGSRVFWTYNEGGLAKHLFVRDTVNKETEQIDVAQAGATGHGPAEAIYQTASADGSKVFFTDPQELTPGSRAGKHNTEVPDLYVAELSGGSKGIPTTVKLTDLTSQGEKGESADVLARSKGSGVVAASENGSSVYFVADAALAPGASRGNCPSKLVASAGATCNLYLDRREGSKWSKPVFVAALSEEDRADWGGTGAAGDLAFQTARVSPNGEYLAFMSNRSLTGYDNEDTSSKAPGERMDEEVFLYDASTGRLACASCDPSGARPTGVFDPPKNGAGGYGEGLGLVVDRVDTWSPAGHTDPWLAGSVPGWTTLENGTRAIYQSRYLSNSGRLFFDSADALLPIADPTKAELFEGNSQQMGIENVYEYEPGGVGSCQGDGGCIGLISSGTSDEESAFLDASASGNDVFFLSSASLVPNDTDSNFDVYDAHVCEPSSPCLKATSKTIVSCDEEAVPCRGEQKGPPGFGAPGSTSASGTGNTTAKQQVLPSKEAVKPTVKPKPLTRAQKLAKALKTCRTKYKHSKSKRSACEKQARKKYGPVKTAGKKASTR